MDKYWYAILTRGGHEHQVATMLRRKIRERGQEEAFGEIMVPTTKGIEGVRDKQPAPTKRPVPLGKPALVCLALQLFLVARIGFRAVARVLAVAVRRDFGTYLQRQLETATQLGLAEIGLPLSSDPIESLFGRAKHHGVGEIQDANRIALRLPALCGPPTRTEAQQVLEISVAQQKALTGQLTSLTKQRREVLSHPECLERLGREQAQTPVELLPGSKNRANTPEIVNISKGYQETSGPQLKRRERGGNFVSAGP